MDGTSRMTPLHCCSRWPKDSTKPYGIARAACHPVAWFPIRCACIRGSGRTPRRRGTSMHYSVTQALWSDAFSLRGDGSFRATGRVGFRFACLDGRVGDRDGVLAGYGWGGGAACVVAVLLPERVRGLISSGNCYNIQITFKILPRRTGRCRRGRSINTPFRRREAVPASSRIGGRCVDCCGGYGRPHGVLTMTRSIAARLLSTTPISSGS